MYTKDTYKHALRPLYRLAPLHEIFFPQITLQLTATPPLSLFSHVSFSTRLP